MKGIRETIRDDNAREIGEIVWHMLPDLLSSYTPDKGRFSRITRHAPPSAKLISFQRYFQLCSFCFLLHLRPFEVCASLIIQQKKEKLCVLLPNRNRLKYQILNIYDKKFALRIDEIPFLIKMKCNSNLIDGIKQETNAVSI